MGDVVVLHMNGGGRSKYQLPIVEATPDTVASLCPRRPDRYGLKQGQELSRVWNFPKAGEFFDPALRAGEEIVLFFEGSDGQILAKTMEKGVIAGGMWLPAALALSGLATGAALAFIGLMSSSVGDKGLEKVSREVDNVGKAVKVVGKSVHVVGKAVEGMGQEHLTGLSVVGGVLGGSGLLVACGLILALAKRGVR